MSFPGLIFIFEDGEKLLSGFEKNYPGYSSNWTLLGWLSDPKSEVK